MDCYFTDNKIFGMRRPHLFSFSFCFDKVDTCEYALFNFVSDLSLFLSFASSLLSVLFLFYIFFLFLRIYSYSLFLSSFFFVRLTFQEKECLKLSG